MKFLLYLFLLLSTTGSFAQEKDEKSNSFSPIIKGTDYIGREPLYFRTQGETTKELTREEFEKIDSHRVYSFTVMEMTEAVVLYGERARNGAIIVKVKGNSFSEQFPGRKETDR